MELVPAIIGKNFSEIEEQIKLIDGKTDWAHLDIMNGSLAPTFSWQTAEDLELLEGKIKLEAHLMIKEPEEELALWIRWLDRVIVQIETVVDVKELINSFRGNPTKLGLALLLETPIEVLEPYLAEIDFVHLLSIEEIGYHGKPFDNKVLEKIKTLRELSPKVTISVDGGINLDNASEVLAAGADRLVVGGALWKSDDLNSTIEKFKKL